MTQPDASAPAPRNVLVTGGNRGIGLAIARAFVEGGDNVVITNRQGDAPEGLRAVRCEVTDTASVNAAFDEAEQILGGPVEVLVANAGITRDTLVMRMSDEDFDDVIATNLAGTFKCVRRASKGMIRLRRGRIVLISSVVGLYGAPGHHGQRRQPRVHRHRDDAVAARQGPRVLPRRHPGRSLRPARGGRERGPVHREPGGCIHQWRGDPGRRRRRHGPLSLVLQQRKGAHRGHPRG
jgi:NAD(P)-dependent dehydrogenase (short-subunit alcohol dehydrogenase family)